MVAEALEANGAEGSPSRAALREQLRRRIRGLERRVAPGLPLGLPALDAALPEGGLPLACLHQVIAEGGAGAATAFLAWLAGRISRARGDRPVLWCLPERSHRGEPHAPGLMAHGLGPDRLLLAHAGSEDDLFWALEEALRRPVLAAVVGEPRGLPPLAARRLQLAAEGSGTTLFLLQGESAASPLPVSRWRIGPMAGGLWRIGLERCRHGQPGLWRLAWHPGHGPREAP